MKRLPTLTGARLLLRQMTTGDEADLVTLFGDEQVVRFMGLDALEDTGAAQRFIEDVAQLAESDTL